MHNHDHNNHNIFILPIHTSIHLCVNVKRIPSRYKHYLQRSRVNAQRSTAILCVGRTLVESSPRESRMICQTLPLAIRHVYLSYQSLLRYVHIMTSYVETSSIVNCVCFVYFVVFPIEVPSHSFHS